jgi:uncharacterized protein (TIGR02996 family)
MTEEQLAMERAVRASPKDDFPRLVYADWLEERPGENVCGWCNTTNWIKEMKKQHCLRCDAKGRTSNGNVERAHFIRAMCHLENNTAPEVYDQCLAWLRTYKEQWFPDRRGFDAVGIYDDDCPGTSGKIRRGFIQEVRTTFAKFYGGGRDEGHRIIFADPIGPTIAAANPVTRWKFDDKTPYRHSSGWAWYRATRGMPSETVPRNAELPDDIFDLLSRGIVYFRCATYASRREATGALEEGAAVRWANAKAGIVTS